MNQKSYYPKASDIAEKWYLIDAEGQVVGRLASRIAAVLRGKNEPTFTPSVNPRNYVVVVNADKVRFSGKKWLNKKYIRHSEHPGGLKETVARDLEAKMPGEVLRQAIHGMLPKTKLGNALQKQLRIFAGPDHTHQAQQPEKIELGKEAASASA